MFGYCTLNIENPQYEPSFVPPVNVGFLRALISETNAKIVKALIHASTLHIAGRYTNILWISKRLMIIINIEIS